MPARDDYTAPLIVPERPAGELEAPDVHLEELPPPPPLPPAPLQIEVKLPLGVGVQIDVEAFPVESASGGEARQSSASPTRLSAISPQRRKRGGLWQKLGSLIFPRRP